MIPGINNEYRVLLLSILIREACTEIGPNRYLLLGTPSAVGYNSRTCVCALQQLEVD